MHSYLARTLEKIPEWERFTPRFLDDLIALGQSAYTEYMESLSEEDRSKLVELGVHYEVEEKLNEIYLSFLEKTETPE